MAGESEEKLIEKDEEQKIELKTMTIKYEVVDDVSPSGYPRPATASPPPRHAKVRKLVPASYQRYPDNLTTGSRSSLEDWDDDPESPPTSSKPHPSAASEEHERRRQQYYSRQQHQSRRSPDHRMRRIDRELNLNNSQSPAASSSSSYEIRKSDPDLTKFDRQASTQRRGTDSPRDAGGEGFSLKRQFSGAEEPLRRDTMVVQPGREQQHSFEGAYKTTGGDTAEKVWLYEENIKKLRLCMRDFKGRTDLENVFELYNLDKNPQRQIFLDEFFNYRRTHGLYCKIPVIARKPLDVFLLYSIVQKYGGFEQTMKNRMWSQIARELELPRTMTSGAFTLKLKYIRLLYQFECYKVKKQVNKSILFNEASILPDSISQINERTPQHLQMHHQNPAYRHHPQASSPSESRRGNADHHRENHDQQVRENVMRMNSKEDQFTDRASFAKTDLNRYSPDEPELGSPSNNEIVLRSSSPPPPNRHHYHHRRDRRLPGSIHSRKRGFNEKEEVDNECIEDPSTSRSHPKSPKLDSPSLARFSVDVKESSRDSIVLKVRMNNDVFEGVLECTQRGESIDFPGEQKM